jgi:hypothetical protein
VFLILKAVPGVTIEYIIEGCHDRVPAELSRRLGPLLSQIELQKITAWSVPKRQKLPTVARAQ